MENNTLLRLSIGSYYASMGQKQHDFEIVECLRTAFIADIAKPLLGSSDLFASCQETVGTRRTPLPDKGGVGGGFGV
jgi:hypothetical protein